MQGEKKESDKGKVQKGPGKGMDRQKAVTIRLNAMNTQKKTEFKL
jgi:hypothetical protein